MSKSKEIGILKWYDDEKGFGLINALGVEEHFFHFSNSEFEKEEFSKGEFVTFLSEFDKNKNRYNAKNVTPIDAPYPKLFSIIFSKDSNIVYVQKTRKEKVKSPNTGKYEWIFNEWDQEINLLQSLTEELLLEKNSSLVVFTLFKVCERIDEKNEQDVLKFTTDIIKALLKNSRDELLKKCLIDLSLIDENVNGFKFEELINDLLKSLTDELKIKLIEIASDEIKIEVEGVAKNWRFENKSYTKKIIESYYNELRTVDHFVRGLEESITELSSSNDLIELYDITNGEFGSEGIQKYIEDYVNGDIANYQITPILYGNIEDELKIRILSNWKVTFEKQVIPNDFEKNVCPELIHKSEFLNRIKKWIQGFSTDYLIELFNAKQDDELLQILLIDSSSDRFVAFFKNFNDKRHLLSEWLVEQGIKRFNSLELLKVVKAIGSQQLSHKDGIIDNIVKEFSGLKELFRIQEEDGLKKLFGNVDFEQIQMKFLNENNINNEILLFLTKKTTYKTVREHCLLSFDYEINIDASPSFRNYFSVSDNTDTGYNKLLPLIVEDNLLKKISDSVAYGVLSKIATRDFDEIYKIINNLDVKYVRGMLNNIEIDCHTFPDIVRLVNKREYNLEVDLEPGSDLATLIEFINNPTHQNNISNINQLLKDKYYSFQLDLYKYIVSEYKNQKLSKNDVAVLLREIKGVQLSALLFKLVVLNPISDRKKLMGTMNSILKKHFTLMEREGLSKHIYNQVFSLADLVNMCNGRKSLEGNFWNEGGIQRYYVNDAKNLSYSNEGYENIYCEGKYWKQTPIYDSDTNKFSGKKCNVYWCRNKVCMGVNDEKHLDKAFEEWTLNDVNELFNVGLDQLAFSHLAGWLNRMNSIFDSLNCRSCKNLLRPLNFVPNQLGYYAVPLFQCVNHSCVKFEKKIRFTHCRGCGKILDSRDCKTCSDCNWLICDDSQCGQCGCGADHNPRYVQYPEA